MGRTPRRHGAEATYHLTARGNDGQLIFLDSDDRLRFLFSFDRTATARGWATYAYCLMGNHIHFVVRTAQADDLPDGMRDLLSRYARSFNRRHARKGHVFQERYHSVHVRDDAQMLALLRYVARNPVKAGLVAATDEWEWSSSFHLLTGTTGPVRIDDGFVLGLFHPIRRTAIARFRSWIEQEPSTPPSVHTLIQLLGPHAGSRAAVRSGHSYRAIAEELGVREAALRQRLCRSARCDLSHPVTGTGCDSDAVPGDVEGHDVTLSPCHRL